MHVTELNQDELDELKQSYVCELEEQGIAEDVLGTSYEKLVNSLDIPNDVIENHYWDIDFSEDDFFCNQHN